MSSAVIAWFSAHTWSGLRLGSYAIGLSRRLRMIRSEFVSVRPNVPVGNLTVPTNSACAASFSRNFGLLSSVPVEVIRAQMPPGLTSCSVWAIIASWSGTLTLMPNLSATPFCSSFKAFENGTLPTATSYLPSASVRRKSF